MTTPMRTAGHLARNVCHRATGERGMGSGHRQCGLDLSAYLADGRICGVGLQDGVEGAQPVIGPEGGDRGDLLDGVVAGADGGVEVSDQRACSGEPGQVERAGTGGGRSEAVHRFLQQGHGPGGVLGVGGGQGQGVVGVAVSGGELRGGEVHGPRGAVFGSAWVKCSADWPSARSQARPSPKAAQPHAWKLAR